MTTLDLAITGGTVIDPANSLHERRDVGIADGRITAIAPRLDDADRDALDASSSPA